MMPSLKTIPFDYVFQLALNGKRGNKVQDVLEISREGVFVALSLGYSLMPTARSSVQFSPAMITQAAASQNLWFIPLFGPTAVDRPSEDLAALYIAGRPRAELTILNLAYQVNPDQMRIREMTLGIDGRATILLENHLETGSIQIWDRTNGLLSEVFKIAPVSGGLIGPHPATKKWPVAGDKTVFVYGRPDDNVRFFVLSSRKGKIVQTQDYLHLDRDSESFKPCVVGKAALLLNTPLEPGDVLMVAAILDQSWEPMSMFTVPAPRNLSTITLDEVAAALAAKGFQLTQGFRLNPAFSNLTEVPLDQISPTLLPQVFEMGCDAAEEVSFLYSFDISGTGREYQNKPIHNIAGLGIANGDRPFRPFAKPVVFEPRSFLRLQIEELSGVAGTLNVVLQGYKILGSGRISGYS